MQHPFNLTFPRKNWMRLVELCTVVKSSKVDLFRFGACWGVGFLANLYVCFLKLLHVQFKLFNKSLMFQFKSDQWG